MAPSRRWSASFPHNSRAGGLTADAATNQPPVPSLGHPHIPGVNGGECRDGAERKSDNGHGAPMRLRRARFPQGPGAVPSRTSPALDLCWFPCPMNRSDLIAALLRANPGLSAQHARGIVSLFFEQMAERIAAGGRIEFRGFGTFSTGERPPKRGRNPKSGAEVIVPAKRVLRFSASKAIRKRSASA